MVVFNYSGKEVSAKVVYYGPGLSGKTTNLEHIYGKVPEKQRGKMVSMKTKTDRTLFFDFLPLSAGEINGFKTRFLLYTVPGQVYYNATRKLVLKGADGVVFVADSDPELRQANKESFANLEKNLAEHGMSIESIPLVLQYNKRDVPNAMSIEELNADLNRGDWPVLEAVAIHGDGVFETFKAITRVVFQKMNERFTKPGAGPAAAVAPGAAASAAMGAAPVERPAAHAAPASDDDAPASAPQRDPAEEGDVIRLSSMERILGGSGSHGAPHGASQGASQGVSHGASHGGSHGAPHGAAHGVAHSSPPHQAHAEDLPASARIMRNAPPSTGTGGEDEPWHTHEVRIPVTVAKLQRGKIRLVLEIDVIEAPMKVYPRAGVSSADDYDAHS